MAALSNGQDVKEETLPGSRQRRRGNDEAVSASSPAVQVRHRVSRRRCPLLTGLIYEPGVSHHWRICGPRTTNRLPPKYTLAWIRGWHTRGLWVDCRFIWRILSLPRSNSTFPQPFKEKCIGKVVRIGSIIIFHLSVSDEMPGSSYYVMQYFRYPGPRGFLNNPPRGEIRAASASSGGLFRKPLGPGYTSGEPAGEIWNWALLTFRRAYAFQAVCGRSEVHFRQYACWSIAISFLHSAYGPNRHFRRVHPAHISQPTLLADLTSTFWAVPNGEWFYFETRARRQGPLRCRPQHGIPFLSRAITSILSQRLLHKMTIKDQLS